MKKMFLLLSAILFFTVGCGDSITKNYENGITCNPACQYSGKKMK